MSNEIVAILNQFLGQANNHNESKAQIEYDCPACAEEAYLTQGNGKHHLSINYAKGKFKCWKCGEHNKMSGPITKLIKRYGNPRLLAQYRKLVPEITIDINNQEIKVVNQLPEGFKKISRNIPKFDYQQIRVRNYLILDRGLDDDIIDRFNIGYTTIGKYSNRAIIPSYDEFGDINYYVGRAVFKNNLKILNADATKTEIIFNEHKINWDSTIYIVEGPFDHLVTPNSIPLLGKVLHEKLFTALYTKANALIVIVLDEDAEVTARMHYNTLNVGHLRDKIRIVFMPKDLDIAKIHELYGRQGVIKKLSSAVKLSEDKL